ncbi:MAG: alcohol dehydrogenase catalytic domain-containing protein [Bacillota bacterium]
MKAAIYYGPTDIVLGNVEVPPVGKDNLLVKVEAAGICGTDLKTYMRGHHLFKPPCILGHEFCGRIVEVGANVKGFNVNDRIAAAPYVPCGKCFYCIKGEMELCNSQKTLNGVFAEYVQIPKGVVEKGMILVPEHVSSRDAALVEPLACCINALEDCNIACGDAILIVGGGPMGLLLLQLCKASGAGKIIVSEPVAKRRKAAQDMGALVVNPFEEDLDRVVKEQTEGRGADVVLVCLAVPEVIAQTLSLSRKGGVVNIFGGMPKGTLVDIDLNIIHYGQVRLLGSFGFAPKHFKSAMTLISHGVIKLDRIVSHCFPFSEIVRVFRDYDGQEMLKVIIDMN